MLEEQEATEDTVALRTYKRERRPVLVLASEGRSSFEEGLAQLEVLAVASM